MVMYSAPVLYSCKVSMFQWWLQTPHITTWHIIALYTKKEICISVYSLLQIEYNKSLWPTFWHNLINQFNLDDRQIRQSHNQMVLIPYNYGFNWWPPPWGQGPPHDLEPKVMMWPALCYEYRFTRSWEVDDIISTWERFNPFWCWNQEN